jgi:hypothetical protein
MPRFTCFLDGGVPQHSSLLGDEVKVEHEVLEHGAQVRGCISNRLAQKLQVCAGKFICHFVGPLEGGVCLCHLGHHLFSYDLLQLLCCKLHAHTYYEAKK